jgi:hypothetical protein
LGTAGHAKKELKKRVRDVRGVERSAEQQTDAASQVVLGYCSAVRSALTDDARPPLAFAGLRCTCWRAYRINASASVEPRWNASMKHADSAPASAGIVNLTSQNSRIRLTS